MRFSDQPTFRLLGTAAIATATAGYSQAAEFVQQQTDAAREQLRSSVSAGDRAEVLNALAEEQEECSHPGWDGYGAEPISLETFQQAYRFVERLPYGITMPVVAADAQGHLSFEWYVNPNRVLAVSISEEGELFYAALLGKDRRCRGTEMFCGEVPAIIVSLVNQLYGY